MFTIWLLVKGLFRFDFRFRGSHLSVLIFCKTKNKTKWFKQRLIWSFVSLPQSVDNVLPDLHQIKNDYPFIVACGNKEDNITRYIIAIDNQPMYVPTEFSFEQTVDLFFKMHYVLSLEFDPRMGNVFLFMEHYIYKMEGGEKTPYTSMIELSNLIV